MAGYTYERTWTGGRPGHKPLFLLAISVICLVGFHLFGRHDIARNRMARTGIAARGPITGRAWVVDGDTIHIARIPIRLEGLDAPEKDQPCIDQAGNSWPCGQIATRQLRERIRERPVTCRPRAIDRYGRVVATCSFADGAVMNAWLVSQGLAIASGGIYASEETDAKADKRGIWAGSFITPREWRRQKGNGWWHRFGVPDR
jgi:endonuclease YncB( thermonuclease family)